MSGKKGILYQGSFGPQFKTSLTMDADVDGYGDGIYLYELEEDTGALVPAGALHGLTNPARLCKDAASGRLYAASDTNEFLNWEIGTGGGVYCLGAKPDGTLTQLAARSSCGVRAVDLALSAAGRYCVVANEASAFCTTEWVKNAQGRYEADIRRDEGCLVLLRLGAGGFEKVCDRVVLPEGQPAHPVSLCVDGDGFVFVANRGGNTLDVYRLDEVAEKLLPVATLQEQGAAGHNCVVRHPSLPVVYCACPASNEVLTYRFDAKTKTATLLNRVKEEEPSNPGQLAISADGATLYVADAERGEIKVYAVSQQGKLVLLQRVNQGLEACQPGALYDLCPSPTGRWLLASDMHGGRLLCWAVQPGGRLGEMQATPASTPTGLLFG